MKKKISMLIALTLVLTMAAGMALAWICPGCNNTNSSNFCPYCGTAKPTSNNCPSCGTAITSSAFMFCLNCGQALSGGGGGITPSASITVDQITLNDDGTLAVTWSDAGRNGPYALYVVQKRSTNYDNDVATGIGAVLCQDNITTTNATAQVVVPGVDYWVVVKDNNGNTAHKEYRAGSLPRFYEFDVDIEISLKYRRNNAYESVIAFSSSDISRYHTSTAYGAYILMDYPQLARERLYHFVIGIEAPNGDMIVDDYGEMSLSRGNWNYYWNFYELDALLSQLRDAYGNVPTGTYTFNLYFDGRFVSSGQFRITY